MEVLEYPAETRELSDSYSGEVLAQAASMGGVPALDAFRRLARQHFPYASIGGYEYATDPGAQDGWLALSLRVKAPVRRFLQDQAEFFTAWSREADPVAERLAVLLPNFD